MPTTNNIVFFNQEKTSITSSTSSSWTLHETVMSSNNLTAGRTYLALAWFNCFSPGTNEGGTKLAFEGTGGDLVGSVQQRHDTNSSGMYIGHLGKFVAPSPVENIGVYRRRLYNGGNEETTECGQFFCIDLTGTEGLESGTDYVLDENTSLRTVASNGVIVNVTNTTSGTCLVMTSTKCYGPDATPTLIGLYIDGTLKASGSRWTQDGQDEHQVLLGGAYNLASGDIIQLRNLDAATSTMNYTCIFALNLAEAGSNASGQASSWTDNTTSGTWGSINMESGGPSFVVGMGRQTSAGANSGRPASISLKNTTSDSWMLFPTRPSGDLDPFYFPATNYGTDVGQLECTMVVGTTTVGTGNDTVEMITT